MKNLFILALIIGYLSAHESRINVEGVYKHLFNFMEAAKANHGSRSIALGYNDSALYVE